jgi:iron complex outermembrane receptor protein
MAKLQEHSQILRRNVRRTQAESQPEIEFRVGGAGGLDDLDVLGYCDWTDRFSSALTEDRDTCDVEVQHRYSFTPRIALTWGGSILTTGETWNETFTNRFVPSYRRETTYSAFLQYDVVLAPDKVRLIAGSKFEHNPYTGFEYQPQVRAVWTPYK